MTPAPDPRDRREPALGSAAGARPGGPVADGPLPARVLIVEDDDTVADVLREVLSDEPIELAFASSAEQALQLIGDACPDLILADITLPGNPAST